MPFGGSTENETTPLMSPMGAIDGDGMESQGTKLTFLSALHLEREVHMNMIQHNLAAKHLLCLQFWLFTLTQAILTMFSSILAFVATTDLVKGSRLRESPTNSTSAASDSFTNESSEDEADYVTVINVIVGTLSASTVFLQTLSGYLAFETRGRMHETVAIDLRDLRDKLSLLKMKMKYKEAEDSAAEAAPANGAEEEGKEEEETVTFNHSFEAIQNRYEQTLTGCKSNIPLRLSEAFYGVKSNFPMVYSKKNRVKINEIFGAVDDDLKLQMQFKLFDDLSSEIVSYFWYPLFLPNARDVEISTMKRFHMELMTYENFLETGVPDDGKGCFC